MSSPRSCRLCPNPVPLESPSGLCPSCAARADTTALSHSTPAGSDLPTSLPDSTAPTATYIPPAPTVESAAWRPPTATDPLGSEAFAPSVSFDVVGDTPAPPGPALPRAPVGYRLLARLGSGGMGDVYLAREQTSERLVAMKFLRFPGNPELLDRFTLELRVLAKLDHPNIVRILSSDFLRSDPFFTMEYLEPGSLAHELRDRTPFAPERAVRITRAIAGALSATHAEGIVHRDLKPSNILLTTDGTPKVADFGLAKRLDEVDPVTAHSVGLGTPSYMPPEQISKRNGALGPWSDVYGLGATLYHLLTGRAPFLGESPPEIIHQVLADEPCRPRALNPAVPLALEAIVLKCLEKDPKDRYPSMAELVAELDRYEHRGQTVARHFTRWERTKRWTKRNRRSIALAVLAVFLLAGAFGLGTAGRSELKPQPANPWDNVRAELAAGREATLIPATGEPERWEWQLGSAVFGPPPTGDGSCYFETVDRALLDLLDDPGIDRYRIRADLRQVRSVRTPDADVPRASESDVGVYFGRTRSVAPNGDTVQALFRVSFRDYDPMYRATGTLTPQSAQFERVLSVVGPQRPPLEPSATFAACSFFPAIRRPGNWYTIEIEVTPEEIAARLVTADGPKPLVGLPPFKPAEAYAELQATVNDLPPPRTGITVPKWTPRLPLGVFVGSSALTVRNVTITPLPDPE